MKSTDLVDTESYQYPVDSRPPSLEPVKLPKPGESLPLKAHRLLATGDLTLEDRKQIVDQSIYLLDKIYAHRRHKLAVHGVDPILQLQALRQRLDTLQPEDLSEMQRLGLAEFDTESPRSPELAFHREMTSIFNGLRDRHTLYLLPRPFSEMVAFLHFDVERARDQDRRFRYVVTRVRPGGHYVDSTTSEVSGLYQPPLQEGWEIASWNGQPIERAIDVNASEHAGSNPAARAARGLERLTTRPLIVSPMPTEAHVQVGFLTHEERYGDLVPNAPPELRDETVPKTLVLNFPWFVNRGQLEGRDSVLRRIRRAHSRRRAKRRFSLRKGRRSERMARGLDVEGDRLHEFRVEQPSSTPWAPMPGARKLEVRPQFADKLGAYSVRVNGERYGYLRIYSFNQVDPTDFRREVERLLTHKAMPSNGLVIDVRGNGGGFIRAGESILQLLTPNWIEPEPFQIKASALARELTQKADGQDKRPDLRAWENSVTLGMRTGRSFSRGIPLTSVKRCNFRGQRYYGPVVLIVDANCYSTTDIFAAGFKDHQIGPIIGIDENTGAGGANVWQHSALRGVLGTGEGSGTRLPQLANGANVSVAIRRSLRVGSAAGVPLEDIGVAPDFLYSMTLDDLFYKNRDLVAQSVELLRRHIPAVHESEAGINRLECLYSGEPSWPEPVARQLQVLEIGCTAETIDASFRTAGIDRLDVFVGGHWVGTDRYVKGRPEASLDIEKPASGDSSTLTDFCVQKRTRESGELELEGYRRGVSGGLDDWELVAVWRRDVSGVKKLGIPERTT